MEKLKADTAPELRSPLGANNNTIAGMTQGDLRRFIVNLLQSDPGAVPVSAPVDTTQGRGNYLGRLPSAPTHALDNDEFDLIVDVTKGVFWRFIYRSASASNFKWEFIGGPPQTVETPASSTTTSATYADLAAGAGPSATMKCAGDYVIASSVLSASDTAPKTNQVGVKIGAAGAVDDIFIRHTEVGAGITGASQGKIHTAAAEDVVKLQYHVQTAGNTGTFSARRLVITPVRIGS